MLKFSSVLAFVAVLVCALLAAFVAVDAKKPKWHDLEKGYSFENYVRDFGRKYSGAEYSKRKALFEHELAVVKAHNKDLTQLYKKGINDFSDMTEQEKKSRRGFSMAVKQRYLAEKGASRKMHKLTTSRILPKTVDYRYGVNGKPVLSAVKDQGQCGSCYAHAAVETVESAWALATDELFVLSQQQAASCIINPDDCGGTGGCGGGIAELVIDTVSDASGLNQEWSYPYESYNGNNFKCSFWANLTVVYTSGYTAVQSNSGGAVMDALTFAGPLAISADASDWSNYESGVATICDYSKNISMDHAIQMVGYGHDAGLNANYWTIRNSWSPNWGENGYIRLLRAADGMGEACGWNVDPQNGNGCKGDTAPVWACGTCGVLYETLYANPRMNSW